MDSEAAVILSVEAKDVNVRAHFRLHRDVHPGLNTSHDATATMAACQRMSARKLGIIWTTLRTGGVSVSDLARVYYWNGEGPLAEAYSQASESIHHLIKKNFLYPVYLDDGTVIVFPARDAKTFLERVERKKLKPRHFVSNMRHVPAKVITHGYRANSILSSLAGQLKVTNLNNVDFTYKGLSYKMSFNPVNWFGMPNLSIQFNDTLTGKKCVVRPDGLGAFGISGAEDYYSSLAPFFFQLDNISKSPEIAAESLARYSYLQRAGALSLRFPQMAGAQYLPPILVVCHDLGRINRLSDAYKIHIAKHPIHALEYRTPIMVTDKITLDNHGIDGNVWLPLEATSDSRTFRLIEILLATNSRINNKLLAETVLRFDSSGGVVLTGPRSKRPQL